MRTICLSACLVLAGAALGAPGATALPGSVSGNVTYAGGSPAAGARVVLVPGDHILIKATTEADGHYEIGSVPPRSYDLGAEPPAGSGAGYASQDGVVVGDGEHLTRDLVLSAANGNGTMTGNASYADHSPDAGVEVLVSPAFVTGTYFPTVAFTGEDGEWSAGQLPAGTYRISFSVNRTGAELGDRVHESLGSQYATLGIGATRHAEATLSGAKPEGVIEGTIAGPGGAPPQNAYVKVTATGGGASEQVFAGGGAFRAWAPSGSYTVTASAEREGGSQTQTVSVSDGRVSRLAFSLPLPDPPEIPGPPGPPAQHEGELIAWLNQQRTKWGLPGGVINLPLWSQACAAHDAYGARNGILAHAEQANLPGHTAAGAWAGEHAVLAAESGAWGPDSNPWNDAPIHLNQMMTPDLLYTGLDDSHGYQCLTTWPGMLRPPDPPGTIYTYPGDGTSGIPPAEFAAESPKVPGEEVGVLGLAGRELFVYEQGQAFIRPPDVTSASLRSEHGPAEVRWVDGESGIGNYLTGAILIPVEPLEPWTTYTATVSLGEAPGAGEEPLPPVSHSWSFTTGAPNPDGRWPRPARRAVRRKRSPLLRLTRRKRGRVIVRGAFFAPGTVRLSRRPGKRWHRRVHVGRGGRFHLRMRWGSKRLTVIARQGKRRARARLRPKRHRHRHSSHRRAARPSSLQRFFVP